MKRRQQTPGTALPRVVASRLLDTPELPSERALEGNGVALVREIALRHDLEAGSGIAALRSVLGDRSLITLDGERHMTRRHLVAPLFRRDLDALDGLTADATRDALREIGAGATFTAYDFARRISLGAIVRFLLPGSAAEEARTVATADVG